MKFLFAAVFLVSNLAFAQIDIQSIKDLNDETKKLSKNFKLSNEKIDVGSPDYKFASAKLLEVINKKPERMENFLTTLNSKLKTKNFESDYKEELRLFINDGLLDASKLCMTILCSKRIRADIKSWQNKALRVNRDLDLGEQYLKSAWEKGLKDQIASLDQRLKEEESELVAALPKDGKECQNLADPSLNLNELTEIGIKYVAMYGMKNAAKEKEEDLKRLKIEDEAFQSAVDGKLSNCQIKIEALDRGEDSYTLIINQKVVGQQDRPESAKKMFRDQYRKGECR